MTDKDKNPVNSHSEYFLKDMRKHIKVFGVKNLMVDDLNTEDLSKFDGLGNASHIEHVRKALKRTGPGGDLDYLVVRASNGQPIAKGAVDYNSNKGAGTLIQLTTIHELRGLGLGSYIIEKLEDKIRQRGIYTAILGVEVDNQDAKRLYERLGYEEFGSTQESWEETDEYGIPYNYTAHEILMMKGLLRLQ
jgi:GNAT superfamily N-acetyltransferase